MKETCVILIDGSNFYHSLKKQHRLPFNDTEFEKLFEKISEKYQINKIYFYDAVKNSDKDLDGYRKQQKFHDKLKKINFNLLIKTRKLKYVNPIKNQKIKKASEKVGLGNVVEKLKKFLRELGLNHLTKEKGIDIMMAIDIINEAKSVKNVIILTGDADFVPAVNFVKKNNPEKNIINLHVYSGSSTELRNNCHKHILINFDENGEMRIIW